MDRATCLPAVLAALLCVVPVAGAADVRVTTELAGPAMIQPGQTTTVNVLARVQGAAGAADGIFTFDLDVVIVNILQNQPSVLAIQSISRPNVDPDPLYGHDGAVVPWGVQAVHGAFLDATLGLGPQPDLLVSVILKGVSVGTDLVVPGPSIDPYGFDFVLYQSLAPTSVSYDAGVRIDVVPEPSTIAAVLLITPVLLRRIRRRPR